MSQAVVARAKAALQAEGVALDGPCGAFAITKRAAQILGPPAGLLHKPTGNNCEGFATDIVCYPDGHIWDCLIDGGGANGPAWQDKGLVDPARYRPLAPAPPIGPPNPLPETDAILVRLDLIAQLLKEILEELRTGG